MSFENSKLSTEWADAVAVQSFMRARAGDGPRIGPFSILFSPTSRDPFANYAIPTDGAEPTASEIAALEAAFHARHRQPRLEYLAAAAPAVEAALLAAGFTVELRPPLMTRRPGAIVTNSAPAGFEVTFIEDPERLSQAVSVQAEAFGGEESDVGWLLRVAARGGRVVSAYCRETGEAAGAGAFIPPIGGVTEVVGLAVRPAFRRRGVAQLMTAMLADEAFRAGCTLAFLSAAGEAQSAIYARAGFLRRSPMLFISKTES